MLEYRRDHQNLHMAPRSSDAHILQWAKDIGDIKDHRLRAKFYNIQRELAQIIMKEVVGKTGMFYGEGQIVTGRRPNMDSLSASRPEAFH